MAIFYKKGFTLVELLVAIGIIATLTMILLPNFMGARERARDGQKIQSLSSMKDGLRMYYNDQQNYPAGSGGTLGLGVTYFDGSNIGFTYNYYRTNGGDGFELCVNLETSMGEQGIDSQIKCGSQSTGVCGMGVGVTNPRLYVVCAK